MKAASNSFTRQLAVGDPIAERGAGIWQVVHDQVVTTVGKVRQWLDEEGWGVIDSPDTAGGCWAHFSSVAVPGYKSLDPGRSVALEWEVVKQDGFSYRAVRTWPAGGQPVPDHDDEAGSSKAYRS